MSIKRRCVCISNSYYNLALSHAKSRNLSMAVTYIKYSLQFNKQNIPARNLLGLIYYEIGEAAEALVQWVISSNIDSENNIAIKYIRILRDSRGELEKHEQNIGKYNVALSNAASNSKDLSIIMLNRVTESNPKYVNAQLLLALLAMEHEDYKKAGKCIKAVLNVDKSNPIALSYAAKLREGGKPDASRSRQFESKRMSKLLEEDVIIPKGYSEGFGWHTAVNILIGLLIGAASIVFIYMPTVKNRMNMVHNSEIMAISDKLSASNAKIDELTESKDSLQAEIDRLTENANTSDESSTYQITQYQLLIGILDAYRKEDFTQAAFLFAGLDTEKLLDIDDGSRVSPNSIYNELSAKIKQDGPKLLLDKGDEYYGAGDYANAIVYYDKSLAISPSFVAALYKKAMAYKLSGDSQNANTIFGDIIINYPDSNEAKLAKTERGY